LLVELHTPGVGAVVKTEVYDLPKELYPVAEIEFPPGRGGDEPLRLRVELKDRC
jgi:hypothetical protein